ncbi:MAG TPA: DUF805 domain-containing protein [Verrucomicrobiae bacterium]|jgi:uncharacterized membrane protein YhaH (DUF805 family)|nr:DUF805 domain-containing protein [Verrucomicrobiae bacterium]
MDYISKGVLSRKSYLVGNLISVAILALFLWILGVAFDKNTTPVSLACLFYALVIVLPAILMSMRLRDIKLPPLLALLWLVPLVDIVVWLVLFFIPTKHQA